MAKFLSKRRVSAVLISAIAGVGSTLLWPATDHDHFLKQPFVSAERIAYDSLFTVRGARADRIDPRIAIVGFTRASEDALRERWPVKRSLHAKLIENLNADGAKLIVFDLLFSGPTVAFEDLALNSAFARAKNVVIAQRIDRDSIQNRKSLEYPYYDDASGIDFEKNTSIGLAEVTLDGDEVIRSFVPSLKFQGNWLPTLATAAFLKLQDMPNSSIEIGHQSIEIAGKMFGPIHSTAIDPVDKSPINSLLVDFPAGMDAFDSTYSYDQVVLKQFPKGAFKGKIVFVGVSGFELAREVSDIYSISSSQLAMDLGTNEEAVGSRSADFGRIPGVFIQAHFLNALLTNGFVTLVPRWVQSILVFLMTMSGISVVRRYLNWRGPVFLVGCALGFYLLSLGLFEYKQMHLPFLVPLIAYSVSISSVAWIERRALKQKWAGYVSPDLLEQILQSEEGTFVKRYDAVAMFGDIRGFTTFADQNDPEAVVRLLNKHFDRFADVIYDELGTIDKFMGDGIMVLFGVPVAIDNPALRAVRTACILRDLSHAALEDGADKFTLVTGFGIASGPFVAGHVGGKKRHDFTAIGDVVNIAARLQGVTGNPDVVIDETTYLMVKEFVNAESLGEIELKGKPRPIPAYRVVSMR